MPTIAEAKDQVKGMLDAAQSTEHPEDCKYYSIATFPKKKKPINYPWSCIALLHLSDKPNSQLQVIQSHPINLRLQLAG